MRDDPPTDLQRLLIDDLVRRLAPPEDLAAIAGLPAVPRPQTDDELEHAVWELLHLRIPKRPVTPGHVSPWQAFCDAYFARAPVSVWLGARAVAGKSFTLAVLAWMEAVTLQASVSILGGSADQSKNVLDYLSGFWGLPTAPRALLASDPSMSTVRLVWKNSLGKQVEIRALAASQRSARGGHPQRLRLDEVDEMEWPIYEAVSLQPMDRDGVVGHTVISSTHHHPDGTMTRLLREALDKGWPIYRWGYAETLQPHGWLTASSVARKRAQTTAEAWRIEVEMEEPSAEGRAIMASSVEQMFVGPAVRCEEWEEYEFEAPVPPEVIDGRVRERASYATGADWAQDRHYTELCTWRTDVRPMRLVAYAYMRRRPYPEMIARLDARVTRYPGSASHDHTGVGHIGSDLSTIERLDDVTLVGRAREDLFRNYILAVEHGEIVAPRIQRLYDQHRFVRTADLFTVGGHPPDGFVAMALAHKASGVGGYRLLFPESAGQRAARATQQELQAVRAFLTGDGPDDARVH
jgi:hypothetical protein